MITKPVTVITRSDAMGTPLSAGDYIVASDYYSSRLVLGRILDLSGRLSFQVVLVTNRNYTGIPIKRWNQVSKIANVTEEMKQAVDRAEQQWRVRREEARIRRTEINEQIRQQRMRDSLRNHPNNRY